MNVISDEIVDLGWKSRHRTRPDHPVRLICVAVRPHESSRGWKGPHCDGVLRLVTNRLDLPAELIAEMYRLRWIIEMFFRTFKQLLGYKHLFSEPAPAQPRPAGHAGFAAAQSRHELSEGLPMPSSGLWEQAQPGWRSAADMQ